MYNKDDKRRLYWLIDMFLRQVITASVFCDEFYFSYNLRVLSESLNTQEQKLFSELEQISSRFSEYEEDFLRYPGVYYNLNELKTKVIETREKLEKI